MSDKLPKLNVPMLRKVQKHILSEPRRLDMETWTELLTDEEKKLPSSPPCGTVGCIGGWTNILSKTLGDIQAAEVLGITQDEKECLFYTWKFQKGKGAVREVINKINLLIRDRAAFVKKWGAV